MVESKPYPITSCRLIYMIFPVIHVPSGTRSKLENMLKAGKASDDRQIESKFVTAARTYL